MLALPFKAFIDVILGLASACCLFFLVLDGPPGAFEFYEDGAGLVRGMVGNELRNINLKCINDRKFICNGELNISIN